MKTETTAMDTIVAPPVATPASAPKLAKTTTITLTANGTTLTLVAERKADETARTYVLTTDADKKTARGMTATHSNFDEARAAIVIRATQAEKLGWVRRAAGRGFVAKPDAFATLPSAPKVVASVVKGKKS